MRLRAFTFAPPYFSWSWKIDAAEVQRTVSSWLEENPDVVIREIKHDTVTSFWYPPQFMVCVYFDDARRS